MDFNNKERVYPMRVVVTGAAGFIGSHVSELLVQGGHEVLAMDDLSGGFVDNIPAGVRFENISITSNMDELLLQFRPECVYHLAAYAAEGLSHHIPVFNYINNVVGTANILSAAYRAGSKHFVFTSSIAAYGHPTSTQPFDEATACAPCDPYGTAKLACENHIRSVYEYYGAPTYTIFRPHNVFGSRQNISDPYRNVVGIFMAKTLRGEPMPIFGDGSQTRSFSHVHSVAHAIYSAPFIGEARNKTFNIGGDEPMSVRDLAQLIAEEMGVAMEIQILPPRKEVLHAHCNHQLARSVFRESYKRAVPIRAGIREMAAYVRQRPIPKPTECPSSIEIFDQLPQSWKNRLAEKEGPAQPL
jgi:UDP-glucose 4-epimerase